MKTDETIATAGTSELHPEDPLALYREHEFTTPPETRSEAFRRLALKHRRPVYALFLAAIVGSFVVMQSDSSPQSVEALLRGYFGRFLGTTAGAYAVGDHRVDEQHLRSLYAIVLDVTLGKKGAAALVDDTKLFSDFVREQSETDLLVDAALKEGVFQSAKARLVMENAVRRAAADYYVYTKLAAGDSDFRIHIPIEQSLAVYEKNRDFYTRSGLDKAQALIMIQRSLETARKDEIHRIVARARSRILSDLKERSSYVYTGPEQ